MQSIIRYNTEKYFHVILLISCTDASVWKEAFEKAKKIVGSECEIYAGKSNPEQKRVESDSESSSDVSYSESTDNEEPTKSPIKQTDGHEETSQQEKTEEEAVTKSAEDECTVTKSEEKLIEEINKLELKNEHEKK